MILILKLKIIGVFDNAINDNKTEKTNIKIKKNNNDNSNINYLNKSFNHQNINFINNISFDTRQNKEKKPLNKSFLSTTIKNKPTSLLLIKSNNSLYVTNIIKKIKQQETQINKLTTENKMLI